jgi:hypothetical protein
MKPLITIFLTCIVLTAHSKDYTFYYRQTQLAEECVLNEQFATALKHYDSAFKDYDFKFARDCFIAAQTAAYIERDSATFKYLSYCIRAGIKAGCIGNRKIFEHFIRTQYWTRLMGIAPELWRQYLSSIDTNLNKEWTKRFDKEQHVKNQQNNEAYFNIIDENVDRIISLLNTGRYPGERTLGIKNTVIISETKGFYESEVCEYSAHLCTPTLQHFNYSYDLLKPKLIKAMYEGQISPQELACIFIFNKYRVCRYRKDGLDRYKIDSLIEHTPDSKVVFNLAFEKTKTDTITANKYRNQWFIPRMGTKLKAWELRQKYGIDIQIGEWN